MRDKISEIHKFLETNTVPKELSKLQAYHWRNCFGKGNYLVEKGEL